MLKYLSLTLACAALGICEKRLIVLQYVAGDDILAPFVQNGTNEIRNIQRGNCLSII
jgi:hypothetical protein